MIAFFDEIWNGGFRNTGEGTDLPDRISHLMKFQDFFFVINAMHSFYVIFYPTLFQTPDNQTFENKYLNDNSLLASVCVTFNLERLIEEHYMWYYQKTLFDKKGKTELFCPLACCLQPPVWDCLYYCWYSFLHLFISISLILDQ